MASSSSATTLAAALGSPPTQLLTRENFLVWKALVVPALRGARVLALVEGKESAPEEFLEAEDANKKKITIENPDYVAWIARDQQVLRFVLNSLSPDVLAHVIGLESSAEVWAAINALVSSKSRSRIQQIRSALNDMKKNDMSAANYFAKMKNLASELAAAGKPLDDDELIWYILHGFGSSYNSLKTAINTNPATSLSDLFNQLQAFDQLHMTEDGTEAFMSSANMVRRGGPDPRNSAPKIALANLMTIVAGSKLAVMTLVGAMMILVGAMMTIVGSMGVISMDSLAVMVVKTAVAMTMVVDATEYPLHMSMLIVRSARNMGTPRVIVGGVVKMIIMVLEEIEVQTLLLMVLTQIGILTVAPQIISLET